MAILTVGTGAGYEYSTLAAAVAAAQNGDVIQVQAGTYDTNALPIVTTKLTIQGMGGIADFVATTATNRAVLESSADITLDHVELSGATDANGNGAGAFDAGGNLTINASMIEHNQDGVLVGSDLAAIGSVDITNSDFGFNGATSGSTAGLTHNLYISTSTYGAVASATIEGNYFHDEEGGGNEMKIGATSTSVIDNVIADGSTGAASYSIDLWNGGTNVVSGNTIEKGPNAPNGSFIHFVDPAGASLAVTNNTFINAETTSTPILLFVQSTGGTTPTLSGDSVYSPVLTQTVNPAGGATVTNLATLDTAPTYSTANPALTAADIDFTAPAGNAVAIAAAGGNLFAGFSLSVPDDGAITLTLSGWKNGTVKYTGSDSAISVSAAVADTLTITGLASAIAADLTKGLFTYTPASTSSVDAITASLSGSASFLNIGTGGAAVVSTSIAINTFAAGSPTSLPDVSGSLSSAANTVLAQAVAGLAPSGTALNVVTTASGATTVAAVGGDLNAVVAAAAVSGGAVGLPAGYHAAYAIGGGPVTLADGAGGSLLVATTANDTVIGAANDTLIGGNATEELVAETGAETIVGGTAPNLIVLNGFSALVTSQGADTVIGGGGTAVIASSGDPLLFDGSGQTDLVASAGAPTVLGAGAETISAGASAPLVFAESGSLDYSAGSGIGTVVAGAGIPATVTGGSGALLYFGAGSTTYSPGSASDTLVGLSGSMTATGGTGADLFFGGTAGNNVLATGPGSTTIVGGGNGDVLTASGNGLDVLAAGVGAATIDASASSGNVFLFAGSGPNSLAGGAGVSALVAGAGSDTLSAGSGLTLMEIEPASGVSARAEVIENFNPNLDFIALPGYAAGTGATAAAAQTTVGGNAVVTLPDGTSLTFVGLAQVPTTSFT